MMQPRGTSPRSPASPAVTGRKHGRPTPVERVKKRPNAAPTSSASSSTPPTYAAWPAKSWLKPTNEWQGSMALLDKTEITRRS
jgi:hypothetical protein